jgi:hypothetical protein
MLKCKFCNRNEKSSKSKSQHELYCKENPDAKVKKASMGMLGKKGSNQFIKGTAKPMTESGKETIRELNRNRPWTSETRAKHSASMKRAVENNPEAYSSSNRGRVKQIEYDGIKFQGNWELDFYKWCVSNNVPCERNTTGFKYEWNGTRTYFPDFYLPEKDEYVEVKGYQTERDNAKWKQFPNSLRLIMKDDIMKIRKQHFVYDDATLA